MPPKPLSHDCDALSGDVVRFTAFLEKSELSRLVIEETLNRAVVRFTGPFEGGDVVWHCEFVTLEAEINRLQRDGVDVADGLRNFIEIGALQADGIPLRVGLNVPSIDAAAVDKMILMIRQYKNLRRGRHEYGGTVNLSPLPRSAQDK